MLKKKMAGSTRMYVQSSNITKSRFPHRFCFVLVQSLSLAVPRGSTSRLSQRDK